MYVVDNGSSDGSVEFVRESYPEVTIFNLKSNLGYSGGCNYGYRNTSEPYVLYLNNDTIQEPDWLQHLVNHIEQDDRIAAVQPKLKSVQDRKKFDYSGACGGELDWLGYPFARGRIFGVIEVDEGQFDHSPATVAWASGTALLLRRSALDECGALDDDFFAHMEEIDLSWRFHLYGWGVRIEPKSVVYHYSGYTLSAMTFKKMYLNHRNNLFMLYKNLDRRDFLRVMLMRHIFEGITLGFAVLSLDYRRFAAVVKAVFDFHRDKKRYREKRQQIQAEKTVTTHPVLYPRSIVVQYFLRRHRRIRDLD